MNNSYCKLQMETIEILFKNEPYLLIGNLKNGAIAKKEHYYNFLPSYAHIFEDGKVKRYNKVIGGIEDIVVVKIKEEIK